MSYGERERAEDGPWSRRSRVGPGPANIPRETDRRNSSAGTLDLRYSLERTVGLWFLLVAAISIGLGVVTFRGVGDSAVHENWVGHTHEVLRKVERIFSMLKDAESGARGFVITSEPRYLES